MRPVFAQLSAHDNETKRLQVLTSHRLAGSREFHGDAGSQTDDRHGLDALDIAVLMRADPLPWHIFINEGAVGPALEMAVGVQPLRQRHKPRRHGIGTVTVIAQRRVVIGPAVPLPPALQFQRPWPFVDLGDQRGFFVSTDIAGAVKQPRNRFEIE